jgi:hypothetical protein
VEATGKRKLRERRRHGLFLKIQDAIMAKYSLKTRRFFDQWKKITKLRNIQGRPSLQKAQRSEVLAAILS